MIKFVVFEGRFDFPGPMLSFFISSTAKASVNPISNKSTVPATRRNMLLEGEAMKTGARGVKVGHAARAAAGEGALGMRLAS